MQRKLLPLILSLSIYASMVSPSFAADGVIELNQSCATGDGCLSGDAAGFPIRLSSAVASSYILTSDLVVPNEGTSAIDTHISNEMTIDLNGFAIRGVTVCSGLPTTCTPTGNGYGIDGFGQRNIEVRNGRIEGMGNSGIRLGDAAVIRNLQLIGNGEDGVRTGSGALIVDSIIQSNGDRGIETSGEANIQNVTVSSNGDDGISSPGSRLAGVMANRNGDSGITGSSMLIVDSYITANLGVGVFATVKSTVRDSHVVSNQLDGIRMTSDGLVIGNVVTDNGTAGEAGILCSFNCSVIDNVSADNAGWGLQMGASTGYRGNTTSGNGMGPVSSGTDLGGNLLN